PPARRVVLRRRHRRPRGDGGAGVRRPRDGPREGRAPDGGRGPPRRHLPLHRGTAVLDQGGVACLPGLGDGRDRHDEHAGGEARARGGALLRDAGARDRLRRVARDARGGLRRGRGPEPPEERRDGEGSPPRRDPDARAARLVATVGEDFPEAHRRILQDRGVDLSGLTTSKGRTFRWMGQYSYDLNEAKTLDTQLNVFAEFRPSLGDGFRRAPFVFLANIDP